MIFAQLLVNSLVAGSIYALVACGFSLIFSTNKFIHFAHGACVAFGAYLFYTFYSRAGLPLAMSVLITILLTSLIGLLMYRLVYRPIQSRRGSNLILLIASLCLLIIFENIIVLIFGEEIRTINLHHASAISFGGALITPLQFTIVLTSLALLLFLWLFMKKTRLGRDMRAYSDNRELASIAGVNGKRIADYSFIVGSGLAGVAGVLIGLEQTIEPVMGTGLMLKGFTGAVVGGSSSVPGSIIGSLILGLAENFGTWFLPSGYKDAIAFVLLFFFLLVLPKGLSSLFRGGAR